MSIEKKYHLAWWRRWLGRPFLRLTLGTLFRILGRVKITGRENIPFGKAYILALNHVSLFDPPFLGVCFPETVEALGASDVWDRPGQNILASMWGGIPVHRGEYDRVAMETALAALRSGRPLLIAPEGGRSHAPGMRLAKPGVAYLVEQAGVPVLPIGMVGTTDDFWHKATHGERPVLEMRIGKPIQLPPIEGKGEARRQSRQQNADLIMRHIAGLLPEEYRGVYAHAPIFPDAQTG